MSIEVVDHPSLLDFLHEQEADEAALRAVEAEQDKLVERQPTPEEIRDTKLRGEAQALVNATDPEFAATCAAIETIPHGAQFTVNNLRPDLDAADVSKNRRGPLIGRAARETSLCRPFMITVMGLEVQAKVPSTDPATKGASVAVWVRSLPTPVEGR